MTVCDICKNDKAKEVKTTNLNLGADAPTRIDLCKGCRERVAKVLAKVVDAHVNPHSANAPFLQAIADLK